MDVATVVQALRHWAHGSYPEEAGVELLVRGFRARFAAPSHPWVIVESDGAWIDWSAVDDTSLGAYS